MEMIPYGRHDLSEDDIEAVTQVLRSDFITQGPEVPRFEAAVAAYCGARHAVAVNSATSALDLAYRALGLGPGDVVWTTPVTFVATANAARFCGADVDFVDIDPKTYNMSVERLKEKLEAAEKTGSIPSIVVPVHLAGQSCDMSTIGELARHYGFRVVEDASHAIGARYQGLPVGNCQYSDITVFSFHPVKIVTTGEGGVAVTNDPELAHRISLLRSHGITKEKDLMVGEPDGLWYYEQIDLGYNYRMTDIHAALGISQLARLDSFVQRRHEVADVYDERLADLPLTIPWQQPDVHSSYHLYVIRVNSTVDRDAVFECLRQNLIGVQLHYIPVYRHPYYARLGYDSHDFTEAERYYQEAISLPIFPRLKEVDQETVVNRLAQCLRQGA